MAAGCAGAAAGEAEAAAVAAGAAEAWRRGATDSSLEVAAGEGAAVAMAAVAARGASVPTAHTPLLFQQPEAALEAEGGRHRAQQPTCECLPLQCSQLRVGYSCS